MAPKLLKYWGIFESNMSRLFCENSKKSPSHFLMGFLCLMFSVFTTTGMAERHARPSAQGESTRTQKALGDVDELFKDLEHRYHNIRKNAQEDLEMLVHRFPEAMEKRLVLGLERAKGAESYGVIKKLLDQLRDPFLVSSGLERRAYLERAIGSQPIVQRINKLTK